MFDELNIAFENVHPQVKINFTEIGQEKFEVSINMFDSQGKFVHGTSQELVYSRMKDERFPAMVIGSAKSFSAILAGADDFDTLIDDFQPSELIIEHILTDKSLSTVNDFASRLDSVSARKILLAQEYIFEKAQKTGIELNAFSESEEKALILIGSFQLCFASPSMQELSTAISELVHNPQIRPLLAIWIKEWAGASEWSCNVAWDDGPLIEELLAYGTYILLEKVGDSVKKQEWWFDVTLIVDICLNFSDEDLKRSGFVIN